MSTYLEQLKIAKLTREEIRRRGLDSLSNAIVFPTDGNLDANLCAIINVANGINDSDAANIAQLKALSNDYTAKLNQKQAAGNYLSSSALNDYYNKYDSDQRFQAKGSYLTAHQSLADYYNKAQIDGKESALSSSLKNQIDTVDNKFQNVYTKTQIDDGFQPKGSYISTTDLSNYYNKQQADEKFVIKGSGQYITENDLSDYYNKAQIDGKESALSSSLKNQIDTVADSLTAFYPSVSCDVLFQAKGDYISASAMSAYATNVKVDNLSVSMDQKINNKIVMRKWID